MNLAAAEVVHKLVESSAGLRSLGNGLPVLGSGQDAEALPALHFDLDGSYPRTSGMLYGSWSVQIQRRRRLARRADVRPTCNRDFLIGFVGGTHITNTVKVWTPRRARF